MGSSGGVKHLMYEGGRSEGALAPSKREGRAPHKQVLGTSFAEAAQGAVCVRGAGVQHKLDVGPLCFAFRR